MGIAGNSENHLLIFLFSYSALKIHFQHNSQGHVFLQHARNYMVLIEWCFKYVRQTSMSKCPALVRFNLQVSKREEQEI